MLSLTRALAARQDKIRNNDKGFTLIELLVVVIIIGILAAIAIPIFLGQQAGARDSAAESDVVNLKIAVVAAIVEDPNLAALPAFDSYDFTPSTGVDGHAVTGDLVTFCVQATSATGTTFYATDSSSVSETAC